jgi:hypothetical protein
MQIEKPTAEEVWNWKANVAKGIQLFNEKVEAAKDYPRKVRESDEFKGLVKDFNRRRERQGLKPLEQVLLLDFSVGNFDDDLQQLELDAIRGYNGWEEKSDRFGLELHEYRVAVDIVHGEEVLRVTDIDEQTLMGKAVWERVPVADRPPGVGNPNYVEEVLSFSINCLPGTVPLNVDIRAEAPGTRPCRILAVGESRKYRAVVAPAGGTLVWTCTGGASIVGSDSAELVTVRGDTTSTTLDDVVLTLVYIRGLSSQTQEIKLTVADVEKIGVRVKASAALTPGRGPLADHQFDCTETVEAFPRDKSLILLRGDFEDVELQATVKPVGTPLAWDVKRASDDALGTGIPKLDQDAVDLTKAKLKTNETGSFFVRVFGDCGNQTFDANGPFKLVPMVLVQATMQADASTTHPAITPLPTIADGPRPYVQVDTGTFDIDHPETAAIHMSATVDVVSGGPNGRRLIDGIFAGWVNVVVADLDWLASYQNAHSIHTVFATNDGTGPGLGRSHIFQPGDVPNLVAPPLLDTGRPTPGTGGATATLGRSRIQSRTNRPLGQRWIVEAVDSPSTPRFPLLHPVFSTAAHPVRLQGIHFEIHFRANLCLWTNRSGNVGDVAERSYGVLRSYKWDMLGVWSIDAANNITVVTPMSIPISGGATKDPLAKPKDTACEVCPPTALSLIRYDGSL